MEGGSRQNAAGACDMTGAEGDTRGRPDRG